MERKKCKGFERSRYEKAGIKLKIGTYPEQSAVEYSDI